MTNLANPYPLRLIRRIDEVLLQLAVGIGVRRQAQPPRGIDDAEGVEGHAAAEAFAHLAERERLSQRTEAVFEVGQALRVEVVAEVRSQKTAVDLPVLQRSIDAERLLLAGGAFGAGDGVRVAA